MSLNIPKEKIYDLGNWSSIATVHDTPDINFDIYPKWMMAVYHG